MEGLRLPLFIALLFVSYQMWIAWQEDYGPNGRFNPQRQAAAGTAVEMPATAGTSAAGPAAARSGDLPEQHSGSAGEPSPASASVSAAPIVRVETPVVVAEIDTAGGTLRSLRLKRYPVSVDKPNQPLQLLHDGEGGRYVAQSGLLSRNGGPDHFAVYRAEVGEYRLAEGQDRLEVPLTWTGADGLTVRKLFRFSRDGYVVDVEHRLTNGGAQPWRGSVYRQLERSKPEEKGNAMIYTFTGAATYTPDEKFKKIAFDDLDKKPVKQDSRGGWIAMLQHYFVSAWVNEQEAVHSYQAKRLQSGRYAITAVAPEVIVPAGGEQQFLSRLYAGPKLQDQMEAVAKGLDLTVDYGWLTVIAQPLFWLLKFMHDISGNWGVAIILLVVLIKAAFFKPSETSYRSMAQMKKMQPRVEQLKARYGEDKQKLNQAMMDLYRSEKINPMSGCLPILIQMPVFIALYWVLLESVELRQAPFALWIKDLAVEDPFYVLPLLMGVTMVVQQRLNPAPADPVQAKVMNMLPFIFTAMFLFFPSGLVLYWFVNNLLSIAQQWVITRRIEGGAKA
jgi:YidC/Oxa1 family membrane protein insertase